MNVLDTMGLVSGSFGAWDGVDGIAFRNGNEICFTAKRKVIENLDDFEFS